MQNLSKISKKEVEGLPLDMMNNLPPNIIPTILTLMPLRDAFRTSILSRSWRDRCVNIPKLKFDDSLFQGFAYRNLPAKCQLLHVVYPILLKHRGPIQEFSLCIPNLRSCDEINLIILHLSRSNPALKEFTLAVKIGDDHKLCASFFKLQHLTHLSLVNCTFQPPSTFDGFGMLVSLSFNNVTISKKVLLHLISSCPLLKHFTLIGEEKHLIGCLDSEFVELFKSLPLVESLCMSSYPIKCFATSVMPQKLPISSQMLPILPAHLKHLHLHGVYLAKEIELLSVLLMVTSSPMIETITMQMEHNPHEAVLRIVMNLIDWQDYSHVTLDKLRVLKITNFTNTKPAMDFVKFILAKSPVLNKVYLVIARMVDIHREVKMQQELLQYPRVSATAEIRSTRS